MEVAHAISGSNFKDRKDVILLSFLLLLSRMLA